MQKIKEQIDYRYEFQKEMSLFKFLLIISVIFVFFISAGILLALTFL